MEIATTSTEETAEFASVLADHAQPGDVLVLVGDLGAGKTAFSKAFGRSLGVTEPMTSPTFTLAREYMGRLPLHHLDVYRLEH
ncbi:MAG: tRNA (adenosine(37)-N6)-threonylcarbamoyltransferase complex ATPase subunit type 1 TsaE, partial [Acidimicrobiales bacterium]